MTAAPWILLRGLTRDGRHWGSLPGRLAASEPGLVVEAFDLPGNGTRYRERSPSTIGGMVEALRTAVQRRRIATPVRVLAMSLGAMVAIEWARRHPEEIAGLVLINTSLQPLNPLHHRLQPGAWSTLLRLGLLPARHADWESAVLRLTSRRYRGKTAAHAELLERWVGWRRSQPVSRSNALRQLWAAARYRVTEAPPVQGVLLASARDALVDPACSQRIAEAWGWPLELHPKAGHDLPLDDPAWVLLQLHGRWDGLAEGPRGVVAHDPALDSAPGVLEVEPMPAPARPPRRRVVQDVEDAVELGFEEAVTPSTPGAASG